MAEPVVSMQPPGPIAEPFGPKEKYTGVINLRNGSLEKGTIVEPEKGFVYWGRPAIDFSFKDMRRALSYLFPKRAEPEDSKAKKPEERKTGFPYLDKGADVGGKALSLDELYKFIESTGIKVKEKPYNWMLERFGKYIGYRDSLLRFSDEDTMYIADHLSPGTKKATAMHELFENPYEPDESKCQSKALEFARKVDLKTYEVLRKMGQAVGLN